ncbi:hypothetical protein AOB46_19375 [Chryseobacterium indologenes]|uniref:DUF2029 domain-containing protein n=2 Tax=Chryseobacterium indologenes TaxID=253 RepID=A0A0N0IUB7_CHRID|nr:hypothetical protein AOB46_19375 [Chryseobacterium indologenes]
MIKNTKNNILSLVFLVLALFPLLYVSYILKNTFLDDSYITLTYSKHFFQEGKPWYNLIDTVQGNGQTSVLWMLIQSQSFNFEHIINPIYINKSISFVLITTVLLFLFQSFRTHTSITRKGLILIFSVFFSIWSAFNISHGLETVFFATVLFFFLKYRNQNIAYLLAFLLPFIRPEAIIFTLFFVIDTKLFSKIFFKRALCVFASILLYFIYTTYYYDVLSPLPFLLKNTQEFSSKKIINFIAITLIFSPIIVFAIKNYKTKLIFYSPLFFFIIYYSFFIDEVMNFFDRYRYPLFVYYIYFLSYENINTLKNKRINILLLILSISGFFTYANYLNSHRTFYMGSYTEAMEHGPLYIGEYLKKKSLEENIKFRILNSDAGAIAYFSDCYLYDTWGLNNATLLLTKKNKDWDAYLSYLKQTDPDYIILISKDYHKFIPRLDFEEKIYKYFSLQAKQPALVRKSMDEYYYFIYRIRP